MKKICAIILLAGFIMSFGCYNYAYALSPVPECESKSIILLDASTGEVLYENNAEEKRIPASVTKLMTLLLTFEALENGRCSLDDIVTASTYASSMGGSQIYLAGGEQMTLEELIIAVAIGSANDAAVAVAEYLAGDEASFVAQMNQKAQDLGMSGTHFVNPNGLPDEQHYTTARDLGILAREIVNNYPQILNYTSLKSYTLREKTAKPFVLYNKNKLLWWYEGADGLKTGWIGPESGYNVVATAQRDDLRLIAVLLGAEKTYGNFRDAMKLFDWGFDNYVYQPFFLPGETIGTCPVAKGTASFVEVVTPEAIGLLNERTQKTDIRCETVYDDLTAPVKQGDKIGEAVIYNADELLFVYPLYAACDVERFSFWQAVKRTGYYFFS